MNLLNTLTLQNPWWKKKKVPDIFLGKPRTEFFEKIRKYLPLRQAILIYGLRRTGKTTFLYQLIQHLIDSDIDPLHILYFSFDEKVTDINEILRVYEQNVLKSPITENTQIFIFFDEIQKLKNWQDKIKLLYDHHPKIKIFLSGSASINLQKKAHETLAGRVFEFEFGPLSFNEFLSWKKVKIEKERIHLYARELKLLAHEYLIKGGFPELIDEKDKEIIRNYIKNSILDKIILQDLPLEFGLKDVELLKTLIESFFTQPGMIINYDKLASNFMRSKVTVINYIFYLKYAMLIREIKNYRPSLKVASRKGKKIYPYNTAFGFIYISEDTINDKLLETAVASYLKAEYYYRNRFEVDFVIKSDDLYPVEVKTGKPEITQVQKFITKFKSPKGFIITDSQEYTDPRQENANIEILPLWKLLMREKLTE